MAQAQRRPKDSPGEPIEAFMARRLREVTGFRGGYRDIAPVLVRALAPGPAGQIAGAVLDVQRRAGAAQDRTRAREVPQARRAAVKPVQSIVRVSSTPRQASPPPQEGVPDRITDWLDQSPGAKVIAGDLARTGAFAPGVARGAYRLARDAVDGMVFGARLLNPIDPFIHPEGEAAWDDVLRVAGAGAGLAKDIVSDPSAAASGFTKGLRSRIDDLAVKTLPEASPVADTFRGEIDRQIGIGLNQGELIFDLGSLLAGGAALKGLSGAGKAARGLKTVEHYVARGVPPSTAAYFVQPYTGMGHHYLPRRTRLPGLLGGGPIPPAISDSPFFLLKPEGIQMGDMYELHYRVDPHFNGGRVPQRFGNVRGWSGKALGWEKEDALGRIWYGAPDPLKMTAGGTLGTGVVGLGAWVDEHDGEEKRR